MNYKLNFSIWLLFSFTMLLGGRNVFAAEIQLETKNTEVAVGGMVQVDVFLNSEGEDINAISSNLLFSEDVFALKQIRDGGSVVNFWVERPELKEGNEIYFSGIIPGGYKGEKGLIASFVFLTLKKGDGNIKLNRTEALLNNGQGSQVKISNPQIKLNVVYQEKTEVFDSSLVDTEPPDSFVPEIGKSENLFDNQWFVVFSAQDKISGIDHYEIQENKECKINDSKWNLVVSPYLIKDQSLGSCVYIKAVDKNKNMRVASVLSSAPSWVGYQKMIILGIIGLVLSYLGMKLWYWKKGK